LRFKGPELWTDKDDQCCECPLREYCPLLDALTQRVALMATESLGVHNCNLFGLIKAQNLQARPALSLVKR
jgi:hypothetical protein